MLAEVVMGMEQFLSTPSARRATQHDFHVWRIHDISIHALREEGDPLLFGEAGHDNGFLSTPSARRATPDFQATFTAAGNFYPRPPRGGRPVSATVLAISSIISIHALREEGDPQTISGTSGISYFYPRPPRGGRLMAVVTAVSTARFLSTPSARRATQTVQPDVGAIQFLSTPSARRATPVSQTTMQPCTGFLSTPSARRATFSGIRRIIPKIDFYPRPPRGGRPLGIGTISPIELISIHALREEGDRKLHPEPGRRGISIHALREEGDAAQSLRRRRPSRISIHALREEGDWQVDGTTGRLENFYPRPPRGGRPHQKSTGA